MSTTVTHATCAPVLLLSVLPPPPSPLQVGVTLLLHLKLRQPGEGSSSSRRPPVRLYSLPGAGLGHQIYAGSVTEMQMVGGVRAVLGVG